jgi:hypothetical protein
MKQRLPKSDVTEEAARILFLTYGDDAVHMAVLRCAELHKAGDTGGFASWKRLFAPDLPEPAVQQGDDFLLNLRIVQQTQERLFESLVLLCLLDLVFSFGSILHGSIVPRVRQPSVPVLQCRKKAAESQRRSCHHSPPKIPSVGTNSHPSPRDRRSRRKSGSHRTLRWREMDSNPRSPVRETLFSNPLIGS